MVEHIDSSHHDSISNILYSPLNTFALAGTFHHMAMHHFVLAHTMPILSISVEAQEENLFLVTKMPRCHDGNMSTSKAETAEELAGLVAQVIHYMYIGAALFSISL